MKSMGADLLKTKMNSMDVLSSNKLQWLDLKIGCQNNSPSNGLQGGMPYWIGFVSWQHSYSSFRANTVHCALSLWEDELVTCKKQPIICRPLLNLSNGSNVIIALRWWNSRDSLAESARRLSMAWRIFCTMITYIHVQNSRAYRNRRILERNCRKIEQ